MIWIWTSIYIVKADNVGEHMELTHCGLGDFNEILDKYFTNQLQWLMAEIPAVKLPSEECH